jgi:hypothetical protein
MWTLREWLRYLFSLSLAIAVRYLVAPWLPERYRRPLHLAIWRLAFGEEGA